MRSQSLELIFDRVGHFGRFQIVLYLICAFQNISCGIHYLASVFMTVSPYHTCRPPGNVSRVLSHNISSWRLEDIWILFFTGHEDRIVVQLQNGEVWELTSCHRFRRDEKSGLNSDYNGPKSSFPCVDGYVYDKSKWDSTVVTQWDLVCNREWFAKVIQPVFMLGVLLGAMIFGYLSDRCSGNSCLHLHVLGDGPYREKKRSGLRPYLRCTVLWCGYGDPQGLLYLDCGGDHGWKICHRGVVWPHLPLYSRAVSNQGKLLVAILAFISGVLSLMLPETMGKPLATTWEEAARQDTENESSGKLFPTTNNTALKNVEVIDSGGSGLGE